MSGCTDHFAVDEGTALERTRDIIDCLNSTETEHLPGIAQLLHLKGTLAVKNISNRKYLDYL